MFDLIIIGSGPAGMTAAIYASRAGLKTLILEKAAPGGKVFLTHLVDNYPGEEEIKGADLAKKMHKHCLKFGAEYQYGDVEKINQNLEGIYEIKTNLNSYTSRAVILATGTDNRLLNVEGEQRLNGKGVSYCAVCDGNFFKNKDVAVIGGGNSAIEETLYLASICKSVTVIHRRDTFRAENITVEKVKKLDNVKFILDSQLEEIHGEEKVEKLSIVNKKSNEKSEVDVSAVFIYVGLIPLTDNFKNFDILDKAGNIVVDTNMRTSMKHLYGAGDVTVKDLRQIATAISDGARAAQSVIEDLH